MISEPERTEVEIIVKKTIKQLYKLSCYDSYVCCICKEYFGKDGKQETIEHIKDYHPEFCHKCNKCECLIVGTYEVKNHKCQI